LFFFFSIGGRNQGPKSTERNRRKYCDQFHTSQRLNWWFVVCPESEEYPLPAISPPNVLVHGAEHTKDEAVKG
jgi:hypothetical protein